MADQERTNREKVIRMVVEQIANRRVDESTVAGMTLGSNSAFIIIMPACLPNDMATAVTAAFAGVVDEVMKALGRPATGRRSGRMKLPPDEGPKPGMN